MHRVQACRKWAVTADSPCNSQVQHANRSASPAGEGAFPVDLQEGYTLQMAPPEAASAPAQGLGFRHSEIRSDANGAESGGAAGNSPGSSAGRPETGGYPAQTGGECAPSLLGRTYLAARGRRCLVVGASKGPGERRAAAPEARIPGVLCCNIGSGGADCVIHAPGSPHDTASDVSTEALVLPYAAGFPRR